ncbi:MAG TPA: SMC-Scp complex subunit ScpB [Candidatus Sulfopaludibacter sp.]|jgi:segregation and condensation protein B|nr:SMC-Scp complex subunit ScpB [Candidatus Sulfopaludibacter sp.]
MEEVDKEMSEVEGLSVPAASESEIAETTPEVVAPEVVAPEIVAPVAPPEAVPVTVDELLSGTEVEEPVEEPVSMEDTQLTAVLEAIVYVAEEPLTLAQLAAALQQPAPRIAGLLQQLIVEFDKPEHGVTIREVAGGYKMATKAEHHEAVRNFVKSLKPPLKLSLPALETLSVIAYKQPVTAPEIMEIRGVQGAGVLKTLLDRKLIAVAGRKNVIGKPILYKTTREFMIQFGLKDLTELPSLKEFEEIRRMAFSDAEPAAEVEVLPEAATEAAAPTEAVTAEAATAEAVTTEAVATEAVTNEVPEPQSAEEPAQDAEPSAPGQEE